VQVLEADLHRTNIDTELFETREEIEEVVGCECQLSGFDIV
jgi:hypothetical protein